MVAKERIERQLKLALTHSEDVDCPPTLADALNYAVFPGGARIRPMLCTAVAAACGNGRSASTVAAAAAIELMHCASLVHDDLPCFDNADVRRGKPTVHKAFGENIAVLTGDALIVLAFETLALGFRSNATRLSSAIVLLSRCTGIPHGIAAGQAWEVEQDIPIEAYHDAKTGALFAAAAGLGALSAGHAAQGWTDFGCLTGRAFQAIDDIRDLACGIEETGKPQGQDGRLGRPNLAAAAGLKVATARVHHTIAAAVDAIPACPGRAELRVLVADQLKGYLPQNMPMQAA